jgi:acyl-CoA synthetase (AMP-forming)/AMP-acid ligase II
MHLTELAREHGDQPAVVMADSGATLSYAELERQSNKIAHLFRSRGLRPGDHIAVLMENRPEFFPVVWAAQRSGLFYTPVNWHLSAAEAAYIVADCGARLLVSSSDLEQLAAAAASSAPALPGRLTVGSPVPGVESLADAAAPMVIERYRVTHGNFVPTMFVRMLKLPDAERAAFDLSSLELVVTAAAPISVQVKEQMIDWLGPIMTEFYAGSEGNGFCVIDSPTWLGRKGSVGKPILGQVHICSDDGGELPAGQIGTVWFSGTRRFSYHNDPAKTAGVYNDKGWSTLGDMGSVDADGFLYLADRRTDLILSGGVNIYPREIEDALALHPAVADIVVFGVPDEEMGQRVHAVVQPAVPGAGSPELAAELIDFCRSRIARYKSPRTVSFDDELPRLPSGKMLRRLLIDRYRALPPSDTVARL